MEIFWDFPIIGASGRAVVIAAILEDPED